VKAALNYPPEATLPKAKKAALHASSVAAGAKFDAWHAPPDGLYDSQHAEIDEMRMRGIFHSDAEGRYLLRTTRPVHYQITSDGPVGELLAATSRRAWRPAHIHFKVIPDAVFGVKGFIICTSRCTPPATRMRLSSG
jgi:protocatechuate 3,4-dioxygenase beta subunit